MVKGKASLKRLKLSNFKLNTLLDISQAINANLTTKELLEKFKNLLRKDLNIGNVIVFALDEGNKWNCILSSGYDYNAKELDMFLSIIKTYDEITNLSTSGYENSNIHKAFDVVIPVFHNDIVLAYILIGDIEEERDGISPTIKHLNFIQTLANLIIVAIENKRLQKENLRQEALRKELELASEMQNMLIPNPNSLPNNDFISVSCFYQPHSLVGGDYYDVIKLSNEEYGFCIADVSGKGISAAILMSNFQANLRALFKAFIPLPELILKLNNIVMQNANGEKFITFFIAKYNTKTKELEYVNAGHNPPFLMNENKNTSLLKKGGIGLGMLDEIPQITKGTVKIQAKDKLLCYTDGLVETEDENLEEFGMDRIEACLKEGFAPEELNNELMNRLDVHKGSTNYIDDISIISVEFHK